MIHGFDLEAPLVCQGIVGDGCGGGRIFFVKDEKLQVYDPVTKETMELLRDVYDAKEISKSGCIITIRCRDVFLRFDLSALKKV
jgi:hypothetical protein